MIRGGPISAVGAGPGSFAASTVSSVSDATALIEASDLDGLVRLVQRLVSETAWGEIVDLRDRCREAVDRGKQVWGPAAYAEYRLALDAPAPFAGPVADASQGRFSLGPLWEVAASTHTWSDLEPYLTRTPVSTLAAHERALRGEAPPQSAIDPGILDVPLRIEEWEPAYPLAVYQDDRADFPESAASEMEWHDLPEPLDAEPHGAVGETFLDLVRPWWEESSGKAQVAAVRGSALEAIRTLGPHRARIAHVALPEALAVMTWAGSGGGAYGRRRGSPVGRAGAWWVLAELLGYDDLPEEGAELGSEAAELSWYRWDPGDAVGGWALHLAVEDDVEGLAWAVSAVDMR